MVGSASSLLLQRRSTVATRAELSADVVARAQRGDRNAQTLVLERYAPMLFQLVRRIAGRSADTDSLTQSLLQRLLQVLGRFDPAGPAKLTTWVYTVSHHFLIDELRKNRLALVPLDSSHDLADLRADPHSDLWRSQVRSALEVAIERLPMDQRRVFVLVHLHEHPLEAVAEAEGVPLGTVKSRLFRAKARLARELGPHLGEGDDHAH